ncbi:MAG: OmpA family protein [Candidatus Eiseniibacteriota bacterium]|jgi:outer membrane protein OmpA-like peptidoglycan-associated protein
MAPRRPGLLLAVLVLLALPVPGGPVPGARPALAADNDDAGTRSTAVTRLGLGARPAALAHAYAAIAGDATCLFTNAAGLATLTEPALDLHHQRRFVDTRVSSFALALPVRTLVVGIGAAYLDLGSVDEVIDFQPTGNRVHSSDVAIVAGAALPVGDRARVGGRFDVRRAVLADVYDDTGVSASLGAQVELHERVDAGVTVAHLGGEQRLDGATQSDPLPRSVRGGLAVQFLEPPPATSGFGVLGVGDLWQAAGSRLEWGLGGEVAWRNGAAGARGDGDAAVTGGAGGPALGVAGRLGYRSGGAAADELRHWTAGLGVQVGALSLDYAFEEFGVLGDVHRVSLGLVRRRAPEPPADADGDGVEDHADRCPGTPAGAIVDADGCPLDGDGDGVPDGLDQCPETPRGAWVGRAGCPLDSDFDGIFDGLDQCPETEPGQRVDAVGCPIPPPAMPHIEFDPVLFDFDDRSVRDSYLPELGSIAEVMRRWPELRVEIAGHADATGPARYNEALSERRARAVAQHLLERFPDIHAERLEVVGYGEAVPLAPNDTEAGRRMNRRVNIVPLNSEAAAGATERDEGR